MREKMGAPTSLRKSNAGKTGAQWSHLGVFFCDNTVNFVTTPHIATANCIQKLAPTLAQKTSTNVVVRVPSGVHLEHCGMGWGSALWESVFWRVWQSKVRLSAACFWVWCCNADFATLLTCAWAQCRVKTALLFTECFVKSIVKREAASLQRQLWATTRSAQNELSQLQHSSGWPHFGTKDVRCCQVCGCGMPSKLWDNLPRAPHRFAICRRRHFPNTNDWATIAQNAEVQEPLCKKPSPWNHHWLSDGSWVSRLKGNAGHDFNVFCRAHSDATLARLKTANPYPFHGSHLPNSVGWLMWTIGTGSGSAWTFSSINVRRLFDSIETSIFSLKTGENACPVFDNHQHIQQIAKLSDMLNPQVLSWMLQKQRIWSRILTSSKSKDMEVHGTALQMRNVCNIKKAKIKQRTEQQLIVPRMLTPIFILTPQRNAAQNMKPFATTSAKSQEPTIKPLGNLLLVAPARASKGTHNRMNRIGSTTDSTWRMWQSWKSFVWTTPAASWSLREVLISVIIKLAVRENEAHPRIWPTKSNSMLWILAPNNRSMPTLPWNRQRQYW